jgi:selenocysteine-specific elongation factor
MFVLGTAGHVDHGKSSVLRALTGMEPDRLPEEKSRGLTINLGFFWSDFPGVGRVGFIDVPGHHRFLANMISGVGEISAFLLVVACDDGWMPQTEEHLQILKTFGIHQGICILTKTDLVDSPRIVELKADVAGRVQKALDCSPHIALFSKEDGESGIKLRKDVENLLANLSPPRNNNSCRIWVDRVFSPKGIGVVVTGTLTDGPLRKEKAHYHWPNGATPTVRGIQCYLNEVDRAEPVTRVAIQLSQIEKKAVSRGDLISSALIHTSKRADVSVSFFKAAPKRNLKAKFYLGTLEEECLLIPLDKLGKGAIRLQFDRPIPLRFGDSFVLRPSGEERLLGGGWVVDPLSRSRTHALACHRVTQAKNTLRGFFDLEFELEGICGIQSLVSRTQFSAQELESALSNQEHLQLSSGYTIKRADWDATHISISNELRIKGKVSRRALTKILCPGKPSLLKEILSEGLHQNLWGGTIDEITLKTTGKTHLSAEENKALHILSETPAIWAVSDLVSKGCPQTAILDLVKRGDLVALKNELVLSKTLYAFFEDKVIAFLKEKSQATTSELKGVLGGVSRKYAIPLLEKMDENRITYLKDGVRKLLR